MTTIAGLTRFFNFKRRLLLIKTHYGRSLGWEVYLKETKIAELLDAKPEDLFWMTYRLANVDPRYEGEIKTSGFWDTYYYGKKAIRLKSKVLGEFKDSGFLISINHGIEKDRVSVRGLYINT